MLAFLQQLGRVRANEITLFATNGEVLYRSPPPTYKAGREAPRWFARLLLPEPRVRAFSLEGGAQLILEADPSRSILDGWDDMTRVVLIGAITLVLVNGLAFWLVQRVLKPFPVIADGLQRLEQGDLAFRLPALHGTEASVIGAAFNRMAHAVQDKVAAERKAREAEARLEERREMARVVEQRLEEERRLIAHELHDEFGQSVTAIRSLAMAIAAQAEQATPSNGGDTQVVATAAQSNAAQSSTVEAARLIADEAAHLYDAMHGLIPRLAPLALDTLGLAETLEGLVRDWRRRYPHVALTLQQDLPADLGTSAALTIYRVVQEGLINALRHAQAARIEVRLESDAREMRVTIEDDGVGLPADWSRPGHFGLRGLRERVANLGGKFEVGNREPRGVRLTAVLPLAGCA
jgi:two-component system sensor histidine kinase UhpB